MKTLFPLAAILLLSACHGRAENSNAENKLEMTDTVSTTEVTLQNGIPVGVQELAPNVSYDVDVAPGHLVILDFNADWCGPCRQFAPIFEEASKQFAGEVEFISVDVETHQSMAQQLGITSIPFILFIQPDGQLNSWVGFLPQAEFVKAIEQLK